VHHHRHDHHASQARSFFKVSRGSCLKGLTGLPHDEMITVCGLDVETMKTQIPIIHLDFVERKNNDMGDSKLQLSRKNNFNPSMYGMMCCKSSLLT
jgi:hypothetical protein